MIQRLQFSKPFSYNKKLTDLNHPDHTLITYPGLGNEMSPAIGDSPESSMSGLQKSGPIEPYVLADIYSWLEAHSGLSHPYVATPMSTLVANTNSSNGR